jgi:hypothetical protein
VTPAAPPPRSGLVDPARARLRQARTERAAAEAEAAELPALLRAVLSMRRAREAGLTPELDRLHHLLEDLVDRARIAMFGTDIIRSAAERLRAAGHGELADATPAFTRALDDEARVRRQLRILLAEHLPQTMPTADPPEADD